MSPNGNPEPGDGFAAPHSGLLLSRDRFRSLVSLRALVIEEVRAYFRSSGFLEVTTASLTQMTGSCERIENSFDLDYYGRRAFLAQSAQLQLELLVKELQLPLFTTTTSFRAEHYDSPSDRGRRLSEFTLFEAEAPGWTIDDVIATQEQLLGRVLMRTRESGDKYVRDLGGSVARLEGLMPPYDRLTWCEALGRLGEQECDSSREIRPEEERRLLALHGGRPVFLTTQPLAQKFFNLRTDANGMARSVDLLCPPIGEVSGGGERAASEEQVVQQLRSSRMMREILRRGGSEAEFDWYVSLFRDGSGMPQRAGFGIGFERLVAFLIDANDILQCVAFPRNDSSLFP